MIRQRLVITGRVQNVAYRDWFVREARAIGVDGWVRNRADGSVEAVVQGTQDMVDALVAKARRDGPPAAHVTDVVASDDRSTETLAGFVKRPTA